MKTITRLGVVLLFGICCAPLAVARHKVEGEKKVDPYPYLDHSLPIAWRVRLIMETGRPSPNEIDLGGGTTCVAGADYAYCSDHASTTDVLLFPDGHIYDTPLKLGEEIMAGETSAGCDWTIEKAEKESCLQSQRWGENHLGRYSNFPFNFTLSALTEEDILHRPVPAWQLVISNPGLRVTRASKKLQLGADTYILKHSDQEGDLEYLAHSVRSCDQWHQQTGAACIEEVMYPIYRNFLLNTPAVSFIEPSLRGHLSEDLQYFVGLWNAAHHAEVK
jgi:hypothetical protein